MPVPLVLRPLAAALVVALTLVLGVFLTSSALAAVPADSAAAELQEWELLDLLNGERTSRGLAPLAMSLDLRDYARGHAADQRARGTLWHDMTALHERAPAGWTRLGENVAYDHSIPRMHTAWMNSSGHRANILDPAYTHVGIGLAVAPDGRIYSSQDFLGHPSRTLPLATRPGAGGTGGGDAVAPTATVTSPAGGARVSGLVRVVATAVDAVGVVRTELLVDGAPVASDTTRPFTFRWSTGAHADGRHTVTMKAYDAAGNAGTSAPVAVTVRNGGDITPPPVPTGVRAAVLRPAEVRLTWSAVDGGVTGYRVHVNGAPIASTPTTSFTDADVAPGDVWRYTVTAYDTAGNASAPSAPVEVTVPA